MVSISQRSHDVRKDTLKINISKTQQKNDLIQ